MTDTFTFLSASFHGLSRRLDKVSVRLCAYLSPKDNDSKADNCLAAVNEICQVGDCVVSGCCFGATQRVNIPRASNTPGSLKGQA